MELSAETKYQLLLKISHKVRDTLDLDEILNHLLDTVQSVIEYDAAGIFVLNQDFVSPSHERPRDLIAGVVYRGFDLRPEGTDPMLSMGKGIIGRVIRTGECVVVPDVRDDAHYVEGRKGTRSEITVPIVVNERAIGALNLESNRPATYSNSDVDVLRFFADAAAISIEKAMLHKQILEKGQIEKQLRVAQDVQSRLLPDESPHVPGYDIDGTCISTFEVGGDYYDYIQLPSDRLGIAIADVSGKSIPAALIMAAFRALLRTQARSDFNPAYVANTLNRLLPDFTGQVDFVTSVYGVLNPLDGCFTYANCGHNPPIVFRADGGTEKLKVGGPLLSIIDDASYNAFDVTLAPGDLLLLYTDGVIEAATRKGDDFGVGRLEAVVRHSLDLQASEIIKEIIHATQEFCGSKSFSDDFTLVIIKRETERSGHG